MAREKTVKCAVCMKPITSKRLVQAITKDGRTLYFHMSHRPDKLSVECPVCGKSVSLTRSHEYRNGSLYHVNCYKKRNPGHIRAMMGLAKKLATTLNVPKGKKAKFIKEVAKALAKEFGKFYAGVTKASLKGAAAGAISSAPLAIETGGTATVIQAAIGAAIAEIMYIYRDIVGKEMTGRQKKMAEDLITSAISSAGTKRNGVMSWISTDEFEKDGDTYRIVEVAGTVEEAKALKPRLKKEVGGYLTVRKIPGTDFWGVYRRMEAEENPKRVWVPPTTYRTSRGKVVHRKGYWRTVTPKALKASRENIRKAQMASKAISVAEHRMTLNSRYGFVKDVFGSTENAKDFWDDTEEDVRAALLADGGIDPLMAPSFAKSSWEKLPGYAKQAFAEGLVISTEAMYSRNPRIPTKKFMYLGRSVKDYPPKGYSSLAEIEGTCRAISKDLAAGVISPKTANARYMRLKLIAERSEKGQLASREAKNRAHEIINEWRIRDGFKPITRVDYGFQKFKRKKNPTEYVDTIAPSGSFSADDVMADVWYALTPEEREEVFAKALGREYRGEGWDSIHEVDKQKIIDYFDLWELNPTPNPGVWEVPEEGFYVCPIHGVKIHISAFDEHGKALCQGNEPGEEHIVDIDDLEPVERNSKPFTKGHGDFFEISLRPASDFEPKAMITSTGRSDFATKDVGRRGGLELTIGKLKEDIRRYMRKGHTKEEAIRAVPTKTQRILVNKRNVAVEDGKLVALTPRGVVEKESIERMLRREGFSTDLYHVKGDVYKPMRKGQTRLMNPSAEDIARRLVSEAEERGMELTVGQIKTLLTLQDVDTSLWDDVINEVRRISGGKHGIKLNA